MYAHFVIGVVRDGRICHLLRLKSKRYSIRNIDVKLELCTLLHLTPCVIRLSQYLKRYYVGVLSVDWLSAALIVDLTTREY